MSPHVKLVWTPTPAKAALKALLFLTTDVCSNVPGSFTTMMESASHVLHHADSVIPMDVFLAKQDSI